MDPAGVPVEVLCLFPLALWTPQNLLGYPRCIPHRSTDGCQRVFLGRAVRDYAIVVDRDCQLALGSYTSLQTPVIIVFTLEHIPGNRAMEGVRHGPVRVVSPG